MFTPFLSPNFTAQLQNQIKATFQPPTNTYRPSQAQPPFYQYDPFQHQTFHNTPHQINQQIQFSNNYQMPINYSNTNCNSFMNSPLNAQHQDDSQEFQRKPTFFGNSLFGSDMFMNHIKDQVQNSYEDSPNSNENPEKTNFQMKNQIQITTIQTFEFPLKQQQLFDNAQNKATIISSVNLRRTFEQKQHQIILEELSQNENQQISQTQKLFDMFNQEELQSKKVQTPQEENHFPQTVSQQNSQESFDKHFFQESIVQEINGTIDQNGPKPSFLKQMSSKIQNSRVQFQKTNSSKFSLKQFNQTLKKPKEVVSNQKFKPVENHELYRAIFELVTKKQDSPRKEPQEMQKIVQKLKLSILPQFQKLQNDYTQKITQMSELVQGMILLNLNKEKQAQRSENSGRKYERRVYNVNQSTIQINLNDDELSDQRLNQGSKNPLSQIEQERQRQQNRLKVSVPMITRTDSEEGLFIPYHSKTSDVDILASINSKEEKNE